MARKCAFTGKRPNVANKVSHSNRKSKKRQLPNLQSRRLWWAEGERFVRIRLSTSAMRTIDRKGLQVYADECGLDLGPLLASANTSGRTIGPADRLRSSVARAVVVCAWSISWLWIPWISAASGASNVDGDDAGLSMMTFEAS